MTDYHSTISIDDERRAHLVRLAAVDPHDLTATVTATSANYGERRRTTADDAATGLKSTKVQAFEGSNRSPSATNSYADPTLTQKP